MIRIGVTAGIGAGKTTVCKEFEAMGIPVYYSDIQAKELMRTNPLVKNGVIGLLGEAAYNEDGSLNRKHIGDLIFNSKELEEKLQNVLKKSFVEDLEKWCQFHKENMSDCHYVLIESAIFFETNTANQTDFMLGVDAPLNMRIARATKRDNATEAEIMRRVKLQKHEENMRYCDFIIHNTNKEEMKASVSKLHLLFVKIAYTSMGYSVSRSTHY